MSNAAKLYGTYMSHYHHASPRRRKRKLSTSGLEAGLFRPFPSPIAVIDGKPLFSPDRHQAVRFAGDAVLEAMDRGDLIYCGF